MNPPFTGENRPEFVDSIPPATTAPPRKSRRKAAPALKIGTTGKVLSDLPFVDPERKWLKGQFWAIPKAEHARKSHVAYAVGGEVGEAMALFYLEGLRRGDLGDCGTGIQHIVADMFRDGFDTDAQRRGEIVSFLYTLEQALRTGLRSGGIILRGDPESWLAKANAALAGQSRGGREDANP